MLGWRVLVLSGKQAQFNEHKPKEGAVGLECLAYHLQPGQGKEEPEAKNGQDDGSEGGRKTDAASEAAAEKAEPEVVGMPSHNGSEGIFIAQANLPPTSGTSCKTLLGMRFRCNWRHAVAADS